jgi:hypothetical protein
MNRSGLPCFHDLSLYALDLTMGRRFSGFTTASRDNSIRPMVRPVLDRFHFSDHFRNTLQFLVTTVAVWEQGAGGCQSGAVCDAFGFNPL